MKERGMSKRGGAFAFLPEGKGEEQALESVTCSRGMTGRGKKGGDYELMGGGEREKDD